MLERLVMLTLGLVMGCVIYMVFGLLTGLNRDLILNVMGM